MQQTTITENRHKLFLRLYQEAFPAVARYVSKRGGSFEEAKDVFQDALVAYYEKTRDVHSVVENEKAFLIGTARNIWLKKLERNSPHLHTELRGNKSTEEEQPQIAGHRLLNFLERSGKKCMELLQAVYYEKLPMKTIAGHFGFSGERSATVQKHKCLEKVRETIREKSLQYEDFYE